jgi:lipoprotein-anchoring transpeptidase ErfK/SrfK
MKLANAKSSLSNLKRITAAFLLITSSLSAQNLKSPAAAPVIRPSRLVLVSIPDRKLAVVEQGKIVRTFAVAVGAVNSPSPAAEFRIVARLKDPTYYHPGVVIPPGPDNPIGPRWIGLDKKGFGIHGTNEPRSIGRAASHGCIRLRNREIEEFFRMVSVGDVVKIRAERDEEIAQVFGGRVDSTTQVALNNAQPSGEGQ